MDGEPNTRMVLIDSEIVWPNALTIDYEKAKLWWADAKLGKIEVCALDGTNRQLVTERNVGSPYSIAVTARYVFWTNWDNNRIERIEQESWNKNQIQSRSFRSFPFTITVVDGKKHEAGVYCLLFIKFWNCAARYTLELFFTLFLKKLDLYRTKGQPIIH